MILNSIKMKNIRSYKSEEIEFKEGVSLFEGDIGSGKSTVLMAIEFALFGLGNQKGDSLLNKNSFEGEVELVFTIKGVVGSINRTLERKSLSGNVSQKKGIINLDGEMEELSPAELKERILEIIDFKEDINPRANSYIYRFAVYTPQEEMKEIITQKADVRLQTLRKAFGIEEYKLVVDNGKVVIRELKKEATYLEGKLEGYGEKSGEIAVLSDDIDDEIYKKSELEEQKEKAEGELKQKEEGIKELNELKEKERNVNSKLKVTKHSIEKAVEWEGKYNEEIKELELENRSKLSKDIDRLKKEIGGNEDNREELEERIVFINKQMGKQKKLEVMQFMSEKSKTEIESKAGYEKNKRSGDIQNELDMAINEEKKQEELINELDKKQEKF